MAKLIDLTGQRFGRWTVIRRWGTKRYKYNGETCTVPLWLCKCDCGVEAVVNGSNLRNGKSKSCGCLHLEWLRERNAKGARNGKAD